jgi:hypothetical protein
MDLISHSEVVPKRVREVSRRAIARELCSISDDRVLEFTGRTGFSVICNVEGNRNHPTPPQDEERAAEVRAIESKSQLRWMRCVRTKPVGGYSRGVPSRRP